MVLAYYPSLDRIKRELFANLAAAQAGFSDIVADFRKMYGTDNEALCLKVLKAAGCGTVDYERFKQIRDE